MSFPCNILLGACLAVALAGCKTAKTDDRQSSDPVSEQAASASQSLGMIMEASTEAVLGTVSGGDSTRSATGTTAEPMPDLVGRAASSTVVDLATASVNGHRLFPTGSASGTITVATSGAAAASWPNGTTQLFTGSVTVTFNNVLLTNGNGDSLSIPGGSFSYTLEAVGTKTDAYNWVITLDSLATLTTPLNAILVHGPSTHSVTLAGNRQVHEELTRVRTVDPGTLAVTVDTRTATHAVSGTVPGSSLIGSAPYNGLNYTRWAVTIDGATVEWNRNAAITTRWDYLQSDPASAFAVTTAHDHTFLATTVHGTTSRIGPFTALQMAALLRAKLEAAWL